MTKKGILTVISGFSGAGKGTIVHELVDRYGYAVSISATTRDPRAGEQDGVHYFFKTKEEFEQMIADGALIEYASYVDNYYGTPKDYVMQKLEQGIDVILEIEMQGALKVKERFPEVSLIFITPPDAKVLRERLEGRGTETQDVIEKRLARAAQECAYMDQYDYHKEYLIENPEKYCEYDIQTKQLQYLIMSIDGLCDLKGSKNYVLKKAYKQFSKAVGELYEFLHIFKSDLKNIEIDRKENKDFWLCDLIMVYDDYKVHAEFESTGIKKLIRLFTYLQKMVRGEIVFIDEFDSNLHDVYLCAILEYLMEHGKGQLCFTTHNVGPMDVLRRRKKSIDFLSENHKIYPWTANGNYSPAKLYRNGMIEGSPFNVDSIDFIGVFDSGEEDE